MAYRSETQSIAVETDRLVGFSYCTARLAILGRVGKAAKGHRVSSHALTSVTVQSVEFQPAEFVHHVCPPRESASLKRLRT